MMAWGKFRSAVVGIALAVATVVPATAADYGWSGPYIGASIGWIGTDVDWVYPNGAKPETMSVDNVIGGGLLGYQQQFGQFVLGIEGSYSGVNFGSDPDFGSGSCPNPAFACRGRAQSILTIGPRLGFAVNDQWLITMSGGFASGRIMTETANVATGIVFDESRSRHSGWYIGAGVDYAVTRNIILGLEYQHIDLENLNITPTPFSAIDTRNGLDARMDVVRARLTYKFGRSEPVYEPMK